MSGIFKLLFLLGLAAFLIFMYLRYKLKAQAAKNIGKKIEKNPQYAEEVSSKLSKSLTNINYNHSIIYPKLKSINYELEFNYNKLYKCYEIKPNTFIVVSSFEYLDTSNENSVEKLFIILTKFVLNKSNDTLTVYVEDDSNLKLDGFRKSFVKNFFQQFFQQSIEI